MIRAASTAIALALALVAVVPGCGEERPPPAGDSKYTPAAGGVGGFGDGGSSSTKPPGCGQKDDGSFCDCIDVPLFGEPPNMYFVLDHSGSMNEGNKWSSVRIVLAAILRGLGPRANFGASIYPAIGNLQCGGAQEILPISPGDPPGEQDGPTTTKILKGTQPAPSGGTPTASALRTVATILTGAKGKTFAILATDGAPNCGQTACTVDQCLPNIENAMDCPANGTPNCCDGVPEACLDAAPTIAAVSALASAGIPVYVIGLPGTTTYGSLLDQLAVAGGTARPTSPKYYRVDSSADANLLTTLKRIAAKIVATCEFKLKEAVAGPNLVNVYLDEVVLPREPVNGWKIEGDTVTLVGQSCANVLAGDVLNVRIITGCPTVEPR